MPIKLLSKNQKITEIYSSSNRICIAIDGLAPEFDPELTASGNEAKALLDGINIAEADSENLSNLDDLFSILVIRTRSLLHCVQSATEDGDADVAEAGEKLEIVMDSVGGFGMLRGAYGHTTTCLENLAKELEKPAMAAALEAIHGGTHKWTNVKNAKNSFVEGRLQYETIKAGFESIPNASEVKENVCEIVNYDIIEHINQKMRKHAGQYREIHNIVKEIVDESIATYKRRITILKKEKERENNTENI